MSRWTLLMPVALVGTDKHKGLDAALSQLQLGQLQAGPLQVVTEDTDPAGPSAAHSAHAQWEAMRQSLRQTLNADNAATVLLRTAGCLASVERAAGLPLAAPVANTPRAAADDCPALHARPWPERLQQILQHGPVALQHEALSALHHHGWRLPAQLLPQALELARRQSGLRDAISLAVGQRGRWLAQQSERWRDSLSAPAEPGEDDWQHGSAAARQAYLKQERQRDPAAARERLQAALPELAAKERAELLPCLALNLGAEDEALLQTLLKDRAAEVRRWAAALLLRLPHSAHHQYMLAQTTPLLAQQSALLGLRQRWVLDAPAKEDPSWKAHAIDPARPKNDSLGERGWWLYQLVRGMPLAWWTSHTGLDPVALVEWSDKSDWREALLRGWRDALTVAPPEDQEPWAMALLRAVQQGTSGLDANALRALLDLAQREQVWLQHIEREPASVWSLVQEIVRCITPADRLGLALSQALARAAVRQNRIDMARQNLGWSYSARNLMPDLCAHLDLQALPLAVQLSPPQDPSPTDTELQAQLHRLLELRLALSQLSTPTP